MAAAITTLGKLGVGTADPVDKRLDFIDFDPGVTLELRDMNGTRGKYDKDTERVRQNRTLVAPRFHSEPTAVELATLLPWALGANASGTSYPLGDSVLTKYVRFDPNNGKKWQMAGVACDAMMLSGSSGEPLSVEMELVGLTYTNPSDSFPAISLDITTQPFIFSDCVLTWDGTARQIRNLSVSIRNNIDRSRHLNSLTLTATNKLVRNILWSIELPSGDYDSLWDTGLTGASLSAVFTNSATSLTLASTSVRLVPRNPAHPFQAEGFLRLEGEAYSAAGATPLTVTLDSTP